MTQLQLVDPIYWAIPYNTSFRRTSCCSCMSACMCMYPFKHTLNSPQPVWASQKSCRSTYIIYPNDRKIFQGICSQKMSKATNPPRSAPTNVLPAIPLKAALLCSEVTLLGNVVLANAGRFLHLLPSQLGVKCIKSIHTSLCVNPLKDVIGMWNTYPDRLIDTRRYCNIEMDR